MLELFWFISSFIVLNLFAGGKIQPVLKQHGGPLPGRGIYYAGLVAILALSYLYSWPGFVAGFSFLIWRLPSWFGSIDAGLDPFNPERDYFDPWPDNQRLRDFVVMAARGVAAFPIFFFVAGATHSLLPVVLLPLFCVAQGFSYDVAMRYANRNSFLAECFSGATWGVFLWGLLF